MIFGHDTWAQKINNLINMKKCLSGKSPITHYCTLTVYTGSLAYLET